MSTCIHGWVLPAEGNWDILKDMLERLKIAHTKTRRLTKSSRASYTVVLPVEFIRHLKWRERQKLDITLEGKSLVIKDWKK